MCMDERCRHPYTCDCEEQCRGKCLRCDRKLAEDENGDFCTRCNEDLDELDALEPKL